MCVVLTFTKIVCSSVFSMRKELFFRKRSVSCPPELERMVGVIMEHGVTEVGMESTSVY